MLFGNTKFTNLVLTYTTPILLLEPLFFPNKRDIATDKQTDRQLLSFSNIYVDIVNDSTNTFDQFTILRIYYHITYKQLLSYQTISVILHERTSYQRVTTIIPPAFPNQFNYDLYTQCQV